METRDMTEIITELVGECQVYTDSIKALNEHYRKNTIGKLRELKEDLELREAQEVIDEADRVSKAFEKMIKGVGL